MKGTLKHVSGLEIPNVEKVQGGRTAFEVRLADETTPNYFETREGWSFEPDEPELPEGDGFAVVGGGYYPIVFVNGRWRQVNDMSLVRSQKDVIARLRLEDVTLYDEYGKDITPNFKEDA